MKKIAKAPAFPALLAKYGANAELMQKILQSAPSAYGKYYHWEKIRRMKPPEGLGQEQWWLALKFPRVTGRKILPFVDKSDNPFTYTLTDQLLRQLHAIDGKAKGFIGVDGNIDSEEARDRYIVSSLIEEAITSSQLEGASTTRKVAAEMLRSGRKPRDPHEQMILNNYLAMRHIRHLVQDTEPLTLEKVLYLHEVLTEKTMDDPDDAGRIQNADEDRVVVSDDYGTVFHTPPPAEELPDRLKKLIAFANSQDVNAGQFIHPVIKAIILHFIVGYDHPFVDGNGRVARALFYYSVLKSGYRAFSFISISKIIKKAPAKYGYAYQYVETDENDVTYFIHHQLEVICRAIGELEDYVNKKQQELTRIEQRIKKLPLNYRQLSLLSHAVRHPGHVYTIKSHQTSHGCAYATARADLLNLAELNLLESQRRGKKTRVFSSPHDIEARIDRI